MFLDRCFPVDRIDLIGGDIEKIFSDFFPFESALSPALKRTEKRVKLPAIDMQDKGASIVVTVDLPGIKKDDITIMVEKNTLKLKALISEKEAFKDEDFYCRERNRSKFERSVALPVKIDSEKIKASLTDGVLSITLSKAQEILPKKIKVEVN